MNHSDLRSTATGIALALFLSGCATMIPEYERPAAPVAAHYPGAPAATESAGAASDIEWQALFGDQRLKRLIETALENNRDLRIAVLNIQRARAQYQVRRADELPTVGIGATGSRQPNGSGGIASVYSAGVSVTAYELDFFGRVRSLSAAALAQYLGTEEARKNVQIALISAVANAYLNLLADDELLAVTRQALATRGESLKLTRLKFDVGATSELDYRQAESLLEGARANLAQLERQRALDENALVLLLGQSLPDNLPQGAGLASQELNKELPAGVPSEVLARRPDVRQAEQQLIAANANIGAARAAFFPRITLTGSAGTASSQLSGLFKSGSAAWTFMPQLLLPIFDSGRNQANLDDAKIGRDIAVAQYEKAIQLAFREVADALAGRATLREQLRAQKAQANAEAGRFRLADLRYRNGVASYLDVLDAQRALLSAQQAVVQVQVQQAQNQVGLYKVLGGGWKAP
ncbi:MAG: efflux transporter outer membrane subunit [Burkholderiales bacterium]|nr:efflux transporter outer membrane subunit [Burkholderiales bacterium]